MLFIELPFYILIDMCVCVYIYLTLVVKGNVIGGIDIM